MTAVAATSIYGYMDRDRYEIQAESDKIRSTNDVKRVGVGSGGSDRTAERRVENDGLYPVCVGLLYP